MAGGAIRTPGQFVRSLHADDLPALFAPIAGQPVVGLAVSGGADSLALMLLAHRWSGMVASPPQLFVYSLDHQLRPEAAAEVAFVLSEAGRLGIEARGVRWEGDKPTSGLMEAARVARYSLIGEAMARDGASVLLTAHHRDDQAETVLMRMAHGSGIEGLSGMAAFSDVEGVTVFRPLLGVSRATLEAVVRDAGLTPANDPSNTDPAYERVRWRQALPVLARLGLDGERIAAFAGRMAEAEASLQFAARQVERAIVAFDDFGAVRIDYAGFLATPPAIGHRVLGQVLAVAGGRQNTRALGSIERLHERLRSAATYTIQTMLGCIVRFDKDAIVVAREPGRSQLPSLRLGPGDSVDWDRRFRIGNADPNRHFDIAASELLQRRQIEALLGERVTTPMEALKTAPIITDADGNVAALGSLSFDPAISVRLLDE